MNTAIMTCDACKTYTLQATCLCGRPTRPAIPPRYSPEDRHAHLIRQAKEQDRTTRGIL